MENKIKELENRIADLEMKLGNFSKIDFDTMLPDKAKRRNDIVKMIKEQKKKGTTYAEIANLLNEKNIPTLRGRGKWYSQSIFKLVK